jgi:hypothetical protein
MILKRLLIVIGVALGLVGFFFLGVYVTAPLIDGEPVGHAEWAHGAPAMITSMALMVMGVLALAIVGYLSALLVKWVRGDDGDE